MELRGCRHFHFINALSDGSVKKVPNFHRSRPTLKFRTVEDIYGDDKSNCSFPAFRPRFVSDGLKGDGEMNMNEIQCLMKENTNEGELEVHDLDLNVSVSEGNSDLEDVTLRHLKKICKSRKRKRLNYTGSSKVIALLCSSAKPDHHNLRPEDNECDLEVPLSALKCKVSKRKKKKKHDVSELSQITTCKVKSEMNDSAQNFLQASQVSFIPLVVKTEVSEPDESHFQSMPCIPKVLFTLCDEPIGAFREVPFEIPETTMAVKSPVSISPTNEAECVMVTMANDQQYDYVDTESPPDVCLSGWEIEKVNSPKLSLISSSATKDPDFCVVNMVPNENNKYVSDSAFDGVVSGLETVKVNSPDTTSFHLLESSLSEFEEERSIIYTVPYSKDDSHKMLRSQCSAERPSLQTSFNSHIQVPDFTEMDGACSSDDYTKDDLSYKLEDDRSTHFESQVSPENSQLYSSSTSSVFPNGNAVSGDDDSRFVCSDSPDDDSPSSNDSEGPSLQTSCNNHIQVPDFIEMDGACSTDDNTKDDLSYKLEDDCSTHFESQGSPENSQLYSSSTSSVFPHGNEFSGDDDSSLVYSDSPDDDSPSNNNSKDDLCFEVEAYCSTNFETHGSRGNCQSETSTSNSVSPPVDSVSGVDGTLSDCPASADDGSPTINKQSPKLEYVNVVEAVPDELRDLVRIVRYHTENPHPTPEKLLSKRKVMSPASQEKLCNAMKSAKLHDHELTTCKEKYISKLSNHRILRAEGLAQIRRTEVVANAKQTNLRLKCNKQGTNQKNINRVPPLPRAVPRFGTGCTSILECSRSAMAFSQRQMSDIDCIASKLTKELRYMKDLMKETLLPEACLLPSKQNVAEVRTAIDNATRLEETAKKWIASMTRDSNRFCKIMQMTQDGAAAASEKVAQKARKISFADEVGGKLCHVKIFEDDTL